MKFLLIVQEPNHLSYVAEVDSESMLSAVASVTDSLIHISYVIDMESGDVRRVYWSGKGQWSLSDTAFNKKLGVLTPDGFFETPQAAEMTENDC